MSMNLIVFSHEVDEKTMEKVIHYLEREGIPYDYQERCTMSFQKADIEIIIADYHKDGIYPEDCTLTEDEMDEILFDAEHYMDCSIGLSWENFYQMTEEKMFEKFGTKEVS